MYWSGVTENTFLDIYDGFEPSVVAAGAQGELNATANGSFTAPASMDEYTHVAVSVESQWLVYLCIAVKVDGVFERKIHKLSAGRGLHSFTSQLNLSSLGHTSLCPPI